MKGPYCLRCGSTNMGLTGYVTYHWRNNQWVVKRRSAEVADTNVISCEDCGQLHTMWSKEPPFDLELIDENRILGR